jgi:hypothetical protein
MAGHDGRLQLIRTNAVLFSCVPEQLDCLTDLVVLPTRPILTFERYEVAI